MQRNHPCPGQIHPEGLWGPSNAQGPFMPRVYPSLGPILSEGYWGLSQPKAYLFQGLSIPRAHLCLGSIHPEDPCRGFICTHGPSILRAHGGPIHAKGSCLVRLHPSQVHMGAYHAKGPSLPRAHHSRGPRLIPTHGPWEPIHAQGSSRPSTNPYQGPIHPESPCLPSAHP